VKKSTVVGIALLSAAVGALLVPPVVQAAMTAAPVKIQDAKSTTKARVVNGYLRVDPNGSYVSVYPFFVLSSGNGNGTVSSRNYIFVTGVAADGALTLTADSDCNATGGDTLWQSGNEMSYSFTGSVFVCGPLEVTNAVGVNWTVYGSVYGAGPTAPPGTASALQRAASAMQRAPVRSAG
jgi:hypothetical protein